MITIQGIPEIIKNFGEYQGRVLQACVTATQIAQAKIVNRAKSDHPYKDRTGNLTNSIQPGEIEIDDEKISAYIEARMAYASFVEFGTSRAQAYPFLVPAMLAELPSYKQSMAREINRIRL